MDKLPDFRSLSLSRAMNWATDAADFLKTKVLPTVAEVEARIEALEIPFNRHGYDPYGTSKKELRTVLTGLTLAYRHYFRVRNHGIENVPPHGRAMLVGNHSGGVALDGGIVVAAMFLEMDPPRLAQSMIEKFLSTKPFFSESARWGQFTGLPEHAERLLGDDRLLLVFPEGAKGTAKLFSERHTLVDFGTGFVRLALKTKSPIVPFAFLGGGEAIPTVVNSKKLGRLVGAPYVPFTPYVLPLPLPVTFDIHYGPAIRLEGDGTEDDETILGYVTEVKARVAELMDRGRRLRAHS